MRAMREDYAARLTGLQQNLQDFAMDLGLIADPETIFWLTGYRPSERDLFQALIVPADGLPILVAEAADPAPAPATSRIAAVRPIVVGEDPVAVLAAVLDPIAKAGTVIGVETGSRGVTRLDPCALEPRGHWWFEDWHVARLSYPRCVTPH
jgi:Xaa-Pro dipeptidase